MGDTGTRPVRRPFLRVMPSGPPRPFLRERETRQGVVQLEQDGQFQENGNQGEPDGPPALRAKLKDTETKLSETEGRATTAETRARQAELKLAVAEMDGVELDARTKFFLDHYQGEPDAESLRKALVDNGFIDPPAPKASEGELQNHERLSAAGAGADAGTGFDRSAYEADLAAARTPGEALAVMARYDQPINTED